MRLTEIVMTRANWQALAHERLADARALLDAGRFGAAYYLAGYVLECSLKACIARRTREHDFPPRVKTVQLIYSHALSDLVKVAGLDLSLKERLDAGGSFASHWNVAKDWSEESRYASRSRSEADDLLAAVGDGEEGVFAWLKQHW